MKPEMCVCVNAYYLQLRRGDRAWGPLCMAHGAWTYKQEKHNKDTFWLFGMGLALRHPCVCRAKLTAAGGGYPARRRDGSLAIAAISGDIVA